MSEPTYSELNYRAAPLPLVLLNPLIDRQAEIDRVLSELFNPIGVKFRVSIRRRSQQRIEQISSQQTILQSPDLLNPALNYRLWIVCSARNSIDCQLLAQPLAKTLRGLNLVGFQDAIVQFSQSAAQVSNWRLKIDLAPPVVILRNWARWGDMQSIIKLLNLVLVDGGMQVSATLKERTLHIFCTLSQGELAKAPTKSIALEMIAPLLVALTPQGIHGATIYGLKSTTAESPVWTHWLDLPALSDPNFSLTPLTLAERGDVPALNFVLHRFLNPDIEQCFAGGGIKLSLLRHRGVIHVMSEAPVCPLQSQVAAPVVKILTQLGLAGMRGIRVYGRVSGQSQPLWTTGVDFDRDPLELPPAAPDEVFVHEILPTKIGLSQRIGGYLVATGIWEPQLRLTRSEERRVGKEC